VPASSRSTGASGCFLWMGTSELILAAVEDISYEAAEEASLSCDIDRETKKRMNSQEKGLASSHVQLVRSLLVLQGPGQLLSWRWLLASTRRTPCILRDGLANFARFQARSNSGRNFAVGLLHRAFRTPFVRPHSSHSYCRWLQKCAQNLHLPSVALPCQRS
jgi:hypothetical protein